MRIVLIEWEDSCSYGGWHLLSDETDNISCCITIGLLCKENDDSITIAPSRSENIRYSEAITIPRSCVTRIRYLKVK
jgi:hypothetical protein